MEEENRQGEDQQQSDGSSDEGGSNQDQVEVMYEDDMLEVIDDGTTPDDG